MRSPIVFALLAISILVTLFVNVEAKSISGDRVLVLLDDLADKDQYSQFWQSLQEREYQLTFITPADDRPTVLEKYGEYLYEHVIHFAYKSKEIAKHKSFGNVQLVKFVNNGGNLLVATGRDPSLAIRDLASEFDIEFDPTGTSVYDHKDTEHDVISTSRIEAPASMIDGLQKPILFSGIGLSLGKIPLLNHVLKAEGTAFVADAYSESAEASDVDLVASLQARNSARATFSGSIALFSDSFFDKKVEQTRPNGTAKRHVPSGNIEFVDQLSKWTFQEKSVLKVVNHRHHKANETTQPETYRVKDDIVYVLEVSEYVDDHWVPFKADDIQLEIIMLDPYIRTTLKQVPVSPEHHYGRFIAHVRLPDVYGVFTLKVNYKRPGLTYLLAEDVVAIQPFRHNEYPRFLTAAYPYYASVGSMIVGFIVFSAVWLSTWGGQDLKGAKQKAH
ncbi:Dolichyl-diphosphooligosaccharide--protein glycosyltransferase subunit WBP1 [Fennellomyces sp. T-0311]|nr:Dolichyl-diphosphooligosaccharide--protein glycosyltransferase subunit WBP1 [Fennellomyces sp. T-0311]